MIVITSSSLPTRTYNQSCEAYLMKTMMINFLRGHVYTVYSIIIHSLWLKYNYQIVKEYLTVPL